MTVLLKIAVLGSGGHALSVLDAAVSAGYEPVAVVDPGNTVTEIFGLPVVPDVSSLNLDEVELCLGIGNNSRREKVFDETRLSFPTCRFPPILHMTAWVSPQAAVGQGTVILSQASVGPHAKTGIGALINTHASLDHDSLLDDFASLAPGASIGGNVSIGARSMIGLNTGILPGVSVGADTVIGAQSLVRTNIESLTVAFGVPCAPKRTRHRGDA
jgi:sugar O-acyltransferase (sialic acid O-acetyltransferase NeuD family)